MVEKLPVRPYAILQIVCFVIAFLLAVYATMGLCFLKIILIVCQFQMKTMPRSAQMSMGKIAKLAIK